MIGAFSRSTRNVSRFSYGTSDLPKRGYYADRNRQSAILRIGLVRAASRDDSTLPQLMLSSEEHSMSCSSQPGQAFGAETWPSRSASGDAEKSNLAGTGGAAVVPDTLLCGNQNGSGTFMRYVRATSLASFALTLHSRDVPACRRPSPPRTVIPVFPQCKYVFCCFRYHAANIPDNALRYPGLRARG